MADQVFLPGQRATLTINGQPASAEYYRWFQLVDRSRLDFAAQIAELQAEIDALSGTGINNLTLQGLLSVQLNGLASNGLVQFQLVNDALSPGNTYYYGTGPTGVKGYFTVASTITATQDGIELVVGSNGVTDIRPDDDLEAIEALSTTGFAARTGANTWALRTWQNGPGVDITNPGGVAGNPQATFNSHTAPVDRIAGSTYSTVQDYINTMTSPGTIDGPPLCIVESGIPATPIRVLAGKGMIRTADDDVSSLPFFDWSQTDFAQPADGLTRFYGVVYNAGTPIVQQRTTFNWDKDTEIPLGSAVIFTGGIAVITPNSYKTGDADTNIIQRFDAQAPATRDNSIGGLILGETGTRNSTLTAGKIWSRLSDFDSLAKNSATTPMLSAFFNGTGLTVASGLTQWDNTRYNNVGAGTLVAMGANKYANLWFFISIDGTKWGFAYGTAEYNTLGAAANEGVPVYLNQNFFQQALLLGRLIFQQGAATASLIESAFQQIFSTTAINNHNDLSGLQDAPDAVANEHYHLSSAQAADQAAATSLGAGMVAKTAAATYAARTITQPAAGITVTNGNGVAGNPTLALANDLAALESLGATGFATRTAADTWTNRSIVGTANRITVTAGDGVSGNPTIDIAATYVGQATITTLGTVTTGTWNGTAIGPTFGGTGQTTYTLGDILYSSAANTLAKLAGNTTTAKQYLSQTGTGAVSAAPVWSAIAGADVTGAALTKTDDTNVTLTLGGTPATALLRAASITVGWTGALAVTRGGVGLTASILGDILYGSGTNTYARLAGNTTTAKQYLSQTGTGAVSAAPAWGAIAGADVTGAALTKTDDTNVTLTLGGTPATSLLRAASLTLGWTGTLAPARGGTGIGSYTAGNYINALNATTLQQRTPAQVRSDIAAEPAIAAGTTAQFWRGDKVFTNTLIGPYRTTPAAINCFEGHSTVTADGQGFGGGAAADCALYLNGNTGAFNAAVSFSIFTGSGASFDFVKFGSGASPAHEVVFNQRNNAGIQILTNDILRIAIEAGGSTRPGSDNAYNLGTGTFRWKEIFAANGTINTSDADEKRVRGPLTPDELSAASEIAKAVVAFQWNEAIEAKGADGARLHIGWIAQQVADIMRAHALDPFRYGFVCYDEWEYKPATPPVYHHETGDLVLAGTPELQTGSRYGLRKDELSAFIIAAQEQRLQALEARLA